MAPASKVLTQSAVAEGGELFPAILFTLGDYILRCMVLQFYWFGHLSAGIFQSERGKDSVAELV